MKLNELDLLTLTLLKIGSEKTRSFMRPTQVSLFLFYHVSFSTIKGMMSAPYKFVNWHLEYMCLNHDFFTK